MHQMSIQRFIQTKHTLALFLVVLFMVSRIHAETFSAQGTVSVSTTTVKNAKVTFIAVGDTTIQYSTTTDDQGHFQLDLQTTAVEPVRESLPTKFELNQNYPNPFSEETSISYRLKQPSDVKVTIFDALGRTVRQFSVKEQQAGNNILRWDGMNRFGQRLPAGVYFYQLQAGGEKQVRKMILCGNDGINLGSFSASSSWRSQDEVAIQSLEGYYHVRIENTGNTFPMVKSTLIEEKTVENDVPLELTTTSYYSIAGADVYVDSAHQIIRGFGASNALSWRPDMTAAEVETAFGTQIGQIGFSILRIMLEPDKNRWSLYLPSVQKAYEMGATIIASPWYAPTDMLETVNGVSRVKHDHYAEYAAHLNEFTDYMNDHGVPLYGISIQNEPDITDQWTSWTADEIFTFMKGYAHLLEGAKVMSPESFHFNRSYSDPILNDSTACANTDIICGHIYGSGLSAYPLAESKGKEVWMTEYLINSGNPPSDLNIDTGWLGAMRTAKNINDCMNANMSTYVWWNIVRYYGPIADGTYAVKGTVTKKGFVMSQFTKFIRPEYYRVQAPKQTQRNVYMSAYKNSASEVVVVLINDGSSPRYQTVTLHDASVQAVTPFTTTQYLNCEQGEDIPVVNGQFTVLVAPSSITTFVSY